MTTLGTVIPTAHLEASINRALAMAITFVCPCGKKLRARDEQASRPMLCPGCGSPITVPAFDTLVPKTESGSAPALDGFSVETPNPDPIGPIFFRAGPNHSDPNRPPGGVWLPLDDKFLPPPADRQYRRKGKRRRGRPQIIWQLETNWGECLLYPFRAWQLVVGLGAGLGIFASYAATYLPDLSERMAEEGAIWILLFGLLGLGTVWYTIGFLDCVLGSAVEGEYKHFRWPKWSGGLLLRSSLTWLLCFFAGPAVFAGAAFAYWIHGGDPDLVDRLILGELSAVAAGYWLLAILAAAESGGVIVGPQAVAALFRRLGVWSCAALLAALTLAFLVSRFAVNSLEEYHRSWFFGGFHLGCAGVAGVYLAVFFLRYLGIRAYYTRKAIS
jgi:hypothetical protein